MKEKKAQVASLRIQLHNNFAQMATLEGKLGALKKELASIRCQQLEHYHNLLSEGREVRQEGLTWIIKTIWHLGADVSLSKLPHYLDLPAIEYLFKVSRLEQEMIEIACTYGVGVERIG